GQIELIKEVVRAFGVNWLELEGFEADDIIATLATQAAARGLTVGIVSGDRDTFQLVDERTTVLYPRKGVSDLARMTPEAIVEKYGLNPGQYADFAALRGDPSDNLPGIPGVGEKTAVKWLNAYSDLAGLIDHVDEVSGKVGDALRGAVPQVLVNRELTELVRDVPVAVDLDSLQWREWSRTSVGELFDSLQFAALRSRVESLPHGTGGDDSYDNRGHDEPPAMDIEIREAGAVPQVLAGVTVGAMAFRGTWAAGRGVIDAVAVCDGTSVVVMPLGGDEDRDALHAWLMDSSVDKRIHDVKGPDLALLTHTGGDAVIEGVSVDTALAAYLDSPGARSYALEDVATRLLGRTLDDQHDSGQLAFDGGGEEELHGLGTQARAVHDIAEVVQERLKDENIYSLLAEMEIPLAGLLARMEYAGIAVDRAGLQGLSEEFGATMREAENAAHQIVGRTFNLGSPKQLQEVLFVDRGLPKTKKIKTGYTTDAEALQNLFATTQDPVLEQLLAWRDVSKLRQTVEGLLPLVDDHGRTHTTFRQTAAATGRLSSSDPNLQNIPIRTEAGRRIRGCFIVGDGFESLMTADYSQIEMRIMADASGDDGLIEAFLDGEDLHNFVAARVFGVDESDVDPEMRRRIKAMSYGLAYGLSAFGLAQQLRISPNEAQDLMDEYFTRFGGVRDYLAGVVDEARKRGYTETMFGRRRYLPDLNHDNRQRREMAERMALNAPIQGTAADIVKVAMLNVDRALT
ncbi:MAG: DNA polymerase I, partial [Candidatus Nanopelagicales bacterium]|nr:DNA polymerase I [Candidatus Nanopelagicales bacterium]